MIEDKELRDLYNVESQERLQHLEAGFLRLEREPANPAVLGELFREAHSLKGASKMVNEKDVEMLAHHMEDILGKAFGGEAAISSETV
ncbi:MAG: Hpt domain-containing protein, partial [Nitrospinae bacterium]|nr:Hpt domain-containing protein [Nitrospinota bacterium]